jgi:PPK2 family polyphosphate:nucleotide phosphotransferase
MKLNSQAIMNLDQYQQVGKKHFDIAEAPTKIKDFYSDKADYEDQLAKLHQEMDDLQSMMYAHNRYGMLLVFQAMDAAGKDSTIKAVFAGVNPCGVQVHSFKRPSETELDHDFLWRTTAKLPERGTLAVFNRSYYEEVLVVKVHSNILTDVQKLPQELTLNLDQVWQQRYEDIVNFEKHLVRNGTKVLKFFLHVSKKEQAERLIERIEDPTKNWKFEEQDVKERALWQIYQAAYQDAINQTSSPEAPWFVIPADDKKNMRLMIAEAIVQALKTLKMEYPQPNASRQAELQQLIAVIRS